MVNGNLCADKPKSIPSETLPLATLNNIAPLPLSQAFLYIITSYRRSIYRQIIRKNIS